MSNDNLCLKYKLCSLKSCFSGIFILSVKFSSCIRYSLK